MLGNLSEPRAVNDECTVRTFLLADEWIDPSLPFTLGRAFLDGRDFPLHDHDYSELVIMSGGEGLHDADGVGRLVHAGDVFVIHRGVKHGFRSCEALSMHNIGFDPKVFSGTELVALPGFHALFEYEPLLRAKGTYRSNLRLDPLELESLEVDIGRMELEAGQKRPGYSAVFRNHFQNLAIFLSRRYVEVPHSQSRALVALGAGIAYLESGLSEDVSVPEAAGRAGLSTNQFISRFSAVYGLTPYHYLVGLRLDRAARLLAGTGRSVTDIAFDCGFNDANYFSRAFRARFGKSPRAYRTEAGKRIS